MNAEATAQRKGGLSAAKQKLFRKLLESPETITLASSEIPRGEKQPWYPTSFQQRRLWFAGQADSDVTIYNCVRAFRLGGPLDVEVLRKSLEEMVRRHAIFRTTFSVMEDSPVQVIADSMSLPFFYVDLEAGEADRREQETEEILKREASTGFDLRSGPLVRFTLLRVRNQEHVIIAAMHHIVIDDWSYRIFFRELGILYCAFLAGQPSPLPDLPVTYSDFAAWQHHHSNNPEHDLDLSYWRKQLAGMSPSLSLPVKPRLTRRTHAGKKLSFPVTKILWDALAQLCKERQSTLFEVLLAAFQVLLAFYAGEPEVVVGTVVSSRDRQELEPLIGFLVNTLVLRGHVSGNLSLAEVLSKARQTVLDAYHHSHLPFELLVRDLQPERDNLHAPLFNIMFSIQNKNDADFHLESIRTESISVESGSTVFDLAFVPELGSGELHLSLQYNTSIFEESTIRRFVTHYERILHAMASDAGQRVSEISILDGSEWQQVVTEWNRTEQQIPALCLQQLFERQADRNPNAVALISGDARLTYTDLNRRANQLAHFLLSHGVTTETPIAICCDRSIELIVGILGILKAGGIYVPLDASYPVERLEWMLDDSRARILLTLEALLHRLPSQKLQTIALDTELEQINSESTVNPAPRTVPSNLAYVMYTSGSTGTPKGVAVEHRSIIRLALNTRSFNVVPKDVFVLLSPVTFDASTLEIWAPLLNGAQLTVFPASMRGPQAIGDFVEKMGVTVLWLTAGLFHQMVETELPRLGGLRQLLTGGDVVSARHVRMLMEAIPKLTVINGYGPTENTTFTTCHAVKGDSGPVSTFPIGKPISNTRVYVLDAQLKPVPVGVAGELFAGGLGLARGYLGHPEWTAEKFIPDPFSSTPGERLYRTGDRVRWQSDGTLEFLGRFDFQVKLRGFRIEPGEIETLLQQATGVRQAFVIVREVAPDDKRLVAYVAADPGTPATDNSYLRGYLQARLPEYMIPSAIVNMDALPLTPNGKVDRKALPSPDSHAYAVCGYEAPQGGTEMRLAEIWASMLKIDQVGRHDNFFLLGGHSLLAVRVVMRVRESLNVEVSVGDLFVNPVLADFARILQNATCSALPPITAAERVRIPLSFAQQQLWFLAQLENVSAVYSIFIGLNLSGDLNRAVLRQALDRILVRHEALRTTFTQMDGHPVQRIHSAEDCRFHLLEHDLLQSSNAPSELNQLIAEEANASFDLEHGPLIRGRLIRQEQNQHLLLITMHHIVADGWSMDVLIRELSALYTAFLIGEPDPLPKLTVQYADYAVWQRKWLVDDVLKQQSEYWVKALEDAPALLELPTDHPRPARQNYSGGAVRMMLDDELTAGLADFSRRHAVTLFMTMLAGWAILLSRLSNQHDVVVGTPVANRGRNEIEGLIGFFVNTLALPLNFSGRPTVGELLKRVKVQVLAAQQHQDIPFEQVVELLRPVRNLGHSPIFQVMFAWHNEDRSMPVLPGLEVTPLQSAPHTIAKFDLTLFLRQVGRCIEGGIEYASSLFEPSTINRYVGHLRTLLQAMVADDNQMVDSLVLLTGRERHQILFEWNETHTDLAGYPSIHKLFEQQVRRAPQALAVVFKEERFTYSELDHRANQLANYLKLLGVGPEVRVGACMQRGPRMIFALLAIWKSGGVYVPLDPDYPPERLSYMLLDTAPLVVITEAGTKNLLSDANVSILDIESHWELIAKESGESPLTVAQAANAAYIIYTSGSTGRPKGVVIQHGSLSNLIRAQRETFAPSESDRILQFFSFSFDVSIFAIVMALVSGARLVLATREELLPGPVLVELLESERITLAVMPPLVLGHMPDAALPALRKVILGGEAWGEELMKRWGQGRRFFNSYGPTETTVQAAVGEYRLGDGRPSIGRPINNARIYLLDAEGNPVPIGVAGELYIGGEGVGRGYLDCSLTAEKFVPDAFSDTPGKRLYRTGDWARWLPDGRIDLLGRKDGQIKLRGFRVELGEVESVLGEHPLVRQCAVVVHGQKNSDKRLVAYVTLIEDKSSSERELRAWLKQKLPDYMVPAQFAILEEFPLNHSGKIDRHRLPAPQAENISDQRTPRTPEEEILCELFAEVLERERVGIDDNFFDLGGHSLKATRLASRIRVIMGRELPLTAIFESPTVAGLAGHLRRAAGVVAPLLPQHRPPDIPLSYAQQRLWFIDQLQGKSSEYNVPDALRLRGPLDYAALQSSINAMVARHEVLRTHFAERNGSSVQIIEPELQVPLLLDDLSAVDEAERQERVRAAMDDESTYLFELDRGPLLRFRLLRLSEQEHILLRTFHHIITDGWSQAIFNREFMALYEAFVCKEPAHLPPLPLQYADYALWQRTLDAALTHQLAYWKEHLAGIPEELPLAKDRLRPARQTFAAGKHMITLKPESVAALKELSRTRQATLYMTLLAGFAVLLARYSGERDIVVGSPVANRQQEQLESLLGFFVNSLVMRVAVQCAESFSDILARVRKTALASYMHQDLPFERLVEELSPQRSLNKTPIYQVMFALQNTPYETMRLKDLEVERIPAGSLQTVFDLELYAFERPEEIQLFWVFNQDLFDDWRIQQMAGHYARLLESVAKSPDVPLHEFNILSDDQVRQLLLEGRGREQIGAFTESVHTLCEQQAELTPQANAISYAGQRLTYRDLNGRANQLAHYLAGLGVGPETLVGLYMDRCPDSIIALLAVLKAGGAYVPLDPAYPKERLRFMAEDAGIKFLLTQQRLAGHLQLETAMVVSADTEWEKISQCSDANLSASINGENAAYAIYTSGSTGKPKGVLVSHRALCNQLLWLKSEFPLDQADRVLQKTSLSFDAAAAEIFLALASGAVLILAEQDKSHDVDYLLRLIAAEQITFADLPPSLLSTMLSQPEISRCDCLKWIFCGGEVLPLEIPAKLKQVLPAELCNFYGPTETTIQSTYHKWDKDSGLRSVPIGKPVANTELYVLDDNQRLVPRGVVGELYIGGAGLARCYLNHPDLTAERFVPNPFTISGGDRIYRTGDLVSGAVDGNLEFIGRVDDQVKIRGYRVELEEIAAALRNNPAIEQAAVAVSEEHTENRRLVAYVVAKPGSSPSTSGLRLALKEQLPDYMVPSQFIFLDALPLTRTGKVDRRALPNLRPLDHDSGMSYVAPQTPLEQMLAQIWVEILRVERVGVDDNFFDLGGHSLLLPVLRSKIQQRLQLPVAIVDFFAHPTLRSLTLHLGGKKKEDMNAASRDSQQRAARQREQLRNRRSPAAKSRPVKEIVQ